MVEVGGLLDGSRLDVLESMFCQTLPAKRPPPSFFENVVVFAFPCIR